MHNDQIPTCFRFRPPWIWPSRQNIGLLIDVHLSTSFAYTAQSLLIRVRQGTFSVTMAHSCCVTSHENKRSSQQVTRISSEFESNSGLFPSKFLCRKTGNLTSWIKMWMTIKEYDWPSRHFHVCHSYNSDGTETILIRQIRRERQQTLEWRAFDYDMISA